MKRESRAPLIVAIVLLVLPVLYAGSYLALVLPGSVCVMPDGTETRYGEVSNRDVLLDLLKYKTYRVGGKWAESFFWPIENADRRLRPGAWEPPVIWSHQ
ncbi:hypothetical protein [Anatilimnocola floriformis]|uniref:hypothetical protein n=1 Tax=Anatilimnocola floriformis TaxID=2948575 RepID=UPI0020C4146E|nr:hypothetical protein [Anatilimnocola floriformis]